MSRACPGPWSAFPRSCLSSAVGLLHADVPYAAQSRRLDFDRSCPPTQTEGVVGPLIISVGAVRGFGQKLGVESLKAVGSLDKTWPAAGGSRSLVWTRMGTDGNHCPPRGEICVDFGRFLGGRYVGLDKIGPKNNAIRLFGQKVVKWAPKPVWTKSRISPRTSERPCRL